MADAKKKKKQIALGMAVRAAAGRNPSFGKAIDQIPHHTGARLRAAKRKSKKR